MIKHYANTGGTIAAFDLPKDEHAPPSSPPTTSLLRRSSRVSDTSSPPPPKTRKNGDTPKTKVLLIQVIEELKDHLENYVEKKFEELIILIKENHSQLMRSRHKENNNVDPQSSNKQPFPHILTDLPDAVGVADCEVGVSVNEGGHQANVNAEAFAPRNRMPSRIIQSPYVTSFGSSEKGKENLDDDVRLYFPFKGCGITYQDSSKLIDEYMQWLTKGILKNHVNNMNQYTTTNCLFISHIKNTYERYYLANEDDLISTQEHIDRVSTISVYERSITNIIKGFEISAALPWRLVDDVYIPVNCGGQFHWVLVVVELQNKVIRMYDSSLGSRK
ncbi:hypothetical protein KY290_017541 [Solanum tuberosum]|uniref:Ubiquitin-like protease family profile domain-containing protein n=1 Tax=Solanum tuberosum TaxID=4113 RepID=A0ABQ7VDP3_SOLTU|nr:hypothetical protein KY290_017541 [Solanum tuberosum]